MTIRFNCEHCGKEIKAPDSAGGKRGKCPYCGQSNDVPSPIVEDDDDIIPLAPIDEDDERRREEEAHRLYEQEAAMLSSSDNDTSPTAPLEQRENVSAADLYHFVVNYCLDMAAGNTERAQQHIASLRRHGGMGLQAVQDFLGGSVSEPALAKMPKTTLERYLMQLGDALK